MAMDNSGVYSIINVGRIFAGPGSIESIGEAAADFAAQRTLIITDKGVRNAGLIEKPERILKAAGVRVEVISDTPPEPSVDHVNAIFAAAKPLGCDMVVGIGGGSDDR